MEADRPIPSVTDDREELRPPRVSIESPTTKATADRSGNGRARVPAGSWCWKQRRAAGGDGDLTAANSSFSTVVHFALFCLPGSCILQPFGIDLSSLPLQKGRGSLFSLNGSLLRATGETTRPQGHGANGAAAPGTLGDSIPTANLGSATPRQGQPHSVRSVARCTRQGKSNAMFRSMATAPN